MSKITRININLPMHSERYEVGETLDIYDNDFSKRIITAITETKYATSCHIAHVVKIYVDGGILAKEIRDTPMSITYEGEFN